MTDKQENILKAALQLFAEQGFDSTSTSKVAKLAGVSEGLIFRHFNNKEGLLSAIMEQGKEKTAVLYSKVMLHDDPKMIIKETLEILFRVDKDDFPFWKLLYALKWNAKIYDASLSNPIKLILIEAFTQLAYEEPEVEAELILVLIDGLAMHLLLKQPQSTEKLKQSIFNKYNI